MKKIFLALCAFLAVNSLCFSQPYSGQYPTQVITGKVLSIKVGDAIKGTWSELVVADDRGQRLTIKIKSTIPGIPVTDKDGNDIELSAIKKDSKVTVGYVATNAGLNMAQSIQLTE
jgi:hypothetical protein